MTLTAHAFATILLSLALAGATALPVRAQDTARPPVPVDRLYADASAKEAAVRKALESSEPLATLLRAVRTVVVEYENVVRLYPTSSFCDDALWRAAMLSRDAFEEFHEARERSTALRLFKFLASQYPSSRLARQAPEQIAWLDAHPAANTTRNAETAPAVPAQRGAKAAPTPAAAGSAVTVAARAETSPSPRLVNIKAIRRTVLPDVVRVVIELDAEVTFHDERLENPSRVFVDLPNTRSIRQSGSTPTATSCGRSASDAIQTPRRGSCSRPPASRATACIPSTVHSGWSSTACAALPLPLLPQPRRHRHRPLRR
jgi:hypothetical protein